MVDFDLVRKVEEVIRQNRELCLVLSSFYKKRRERPSINALLRAILRVLEHGEACLLFIEALRAATSTERRSVLIVKRPRLAILRPQSQYSVEVRDKSERASYGT